MGKILQAQEEDDSARQGAKMRNLPSFCRAVLPIIRRTKKLQKPSVIVANKNCMDIRFSGKEDTKNRLICAQFA